MPLNNCNEAQLCAVKHFQGPMLLTAGPGSGKTFTIVERIRYLIEHYKVEPSNILVITFTKAAALEMEQRFSKAMKGTKYPVNFGTFHAVFFHILKQAYQYQFNNIISEKEKREYATYALEGIRKEIDEAFLEQLFSEFSKVKNSVGGIAHYQFESGFMEPEEFQAVYIKYRNICIENKKMDFDDMALQCLELFKRRKEILHKWQKHFPFILVDEFQDINSAQYSVVSLLAGENKNLFVVGDDDQSIYGFRGAEPVIMQKFLTDFPDAKKVVLDKNYRSGKQIIEMAMQVIEQNKNRLPKTIKPGTEKEGEVVWNACPNKEKQYENLLIKLKQYQQNDQLKQCAVIFRTNRGANSFKRLLQKEGIPFEGKLQENSFCEHFILRDIEDYIRFAKGEATRERMFRIMNKPSRYISRESVGEGEVDFSRIKQYYRDNPQQIKNLSKLEKELNELKNMSPFLAVNYIRKAMEYDQYIKEIASKNGTYSMEEIWEIAEQIQMDAKAYRSTEEWLLSIAERRQNKISQKTENSENSGDKDIKDAISVITMHGAKGLEFETVFLPDLNEGNVPYGKLLSREEEEEERRIFYVALTRAKRKLELFYVENEKEKPSRFFPFYSESTISSNSALSRYSSKASATISYSSSSSMYSNSGSALTSFSSSK